MPIFVLTSNQTELQHSFEYTMYLKKTKKNTHFYPGNLSMTVIKGIQESVITGEPLGLRT